MTGSHDGNTTEPLSDTEWRMLLDDPEAQGLVAAITEASLEACKETP